MSDEEPKEKKVVTKKPIFKTEMEVHEGWLENLRNEERAMKESLKKCIDGGYTSNPSRAKQILQFAFGDSDQGSIPSESRQNAMRVGNSKGLLGQKELLKQKVPNQEVLLEHKLILNRPDHFPLEFLLPKNGKRFMNNKTTRAMQSKISLKLPLASAELPQHKPKMKQNIKQSIIDDFEKAYKLNCD